MIIMEGEGQFFVLGCGHNGATVQSFGDPEVTDDGILPLTFVDNLPVRKQD